MADVTKFRLFGIDYNVKDSTARTNANNALVNANSAVQTANNANITANNAITIANRMPILAGKGSIVCIGDSYLQGYTPDGNVNSWGIQLRNRLGRSTSNFFIKAEGGAGFANVGQQGHTFEGLVDQAISDSSIVKADVSLFIVGGGYNDASASKPTAEIVAGMSNVKTKIRNSFPNAEILYVFMANSQFPDNLTYDKLYNTYYRWIRGANNAGVPIVYNAGVVLKGETDATMATDGRHPNEYGESLIMQTILNYLYGGNALNVSQTFDYANTKAIWSLSDNSTVTIAFYGNSDYDPSISSGTLNGITKFGEYNFAELGIKPTADFMSFTIVGYVCTGTGSSRLYYRSDIHIKFTKNGVMEFYPERINNGLTNYESLTNVTNIRIIPQTVVIPRILC